MNSKLLQFLLWAFAGCLSVTLCVLVYFPASWLGYIVDHLWRMSYQTPRLWRLH